MATPRFLIDQNVQESVATFRTEEGCEVLRVREVSGQASPDRLIAFMADSAGLVIVTHDHDSRRFSKLVAGAQRAQFVAGAGVITLRVREPQAAARLRSVWRHALYHFGDAADRKARLHPVVTETSIQVVDNARPS